jgi:hypothetical protein
MLEALQVANSDLWLAVMGNIGIPDDVRREVSETTVPSIDDNRSSIRGSGVAMLAEFAVSGIVGNAAWAAFPATRQYLKALHARLRGKPPIQSSAVVEALTEMARSVAGPGVAVDVRSLRQLPDGSWDCEILCDGSLALAQVDRSGSIVVWAIADSAD